MAVNQAVSFPQAFASYLLAERHRAGFQSEILIPDPGLWEG